MSTKCHQDVLLVIYDKKNKTLVELNSTPEFDVDALLRVKMNEQNLNYQRYCNEDLKLLESNMTPKQFAKIDQETAHQKAKRLKTEAEQMVANQLNVV